MSEGRGRWLAVVFVATAVAGCMTPEKVVKELGGRIYVANESSNSVTVLDSETFTVVGTIDAKNHATHDLALTRDGKRLFATNLASGRVSVIDTEAMETIGSIYTGPRSHVIALTNDNKHAWVANIGNDTVSIIDVASLRILGTLRTGSGPTGIAFTRDGRWAYVSNQGDKTVAVVDTTTHEIVKRIVVGSNPHFLVLGPDGRVWGANTGGNDIYVISPATHEIVATLVVGAAPQQIAFGFKGVAGPYAYVTVASTNKVAVVNSDLRDLRVVEQIDVGQRPNGIWSNPQGTRMFVVHENSNDLYVIDTGVSQAIATAPTGRKPIRVIVSR